MTDRDSPTPAVAQARPGAVPAQFSINNARYVLDPSSTTSDIGCDIGCALESLEELLHTSAERAGDDCKTGLLVYAAINLVQQIQGLSSEYIARATQLTGASAPKEVKSNAPAQTKSATSAAEMAQSLSDAACASNAIRATLDEMQVAVYSDLGSVEQGLYEAAVASTERLDRALSRGIEAGSVQTPGLPRSVQ